MSPKTGADKAERADIILAGTVVVEEMSASS
jgi:hypothetical protein